MSIFEASPADETWYLWLKFLMSLAIVVALPVAVVVGFRHCLIQWSSNDWPSTQMTITDIGPISNHGVELSYKFEVDGVPYTGSMTTGRKKIVPVDKKALAQKFAVGTIHDVYYNPDDPDRYNVLTPGGNYVMQSIVTFLLALVAVQAGFSVRSHYQLLFSAPDLKGSGINGFSPSQLERFRLMTDNSDPGYLRLDHDLLKRFHPEWYPSGLGHIPRIAASCLGQSDPREVVRWHLLLGDRSPAVVVSVDPFCVAAYTEGLDCIAMLWFDLNLIPPKFRKRGTKLVTLNLDYSSKFGPLAADLTPGDPNSDYWTNFLPLIGDFLSLETERLEELKRSIPSSWWNRVAHFAKNYDYEGKSVRDGCPYLAAQPNCGDHRWRMIDRGS